MHIVVPKGDGAFVAHTSPAAQSICWTFGARQPSARVDHETGGFVTVGFAAEGVHVAVTVGSGT